MEEFYSRSSQNEIFNFMSNGSGNEDTHSMTLLQQSYGLSGSKFHYLAYLQGLIYNSGCESVL